MSEADAIAMSEADAIAMSEADAIAPWLDASFYKCWTVAQPRLRERAFKPGGATATAADVLARGRRLAELYRWASESMVRLDAMERAFDAAQRAAELEDIKKPNLDNIERRALLQPDAARSFMSELREEFAAWSRSGDGDALPPPWALWTKYVAFSDDGHDGERSRRWLLDPFDSTHAEAELVRRGMLSRQTPPMERLRREDGVRSIACAVTEWVANGLPDPLSNDGLRYFRAVHRYRSNVGTCVADDAPTCPECRASVDSLLTPDEWKRYAGKHPTPGDVDRLGGALCGREPASFARARRRQTRPVLDVAQSIIMWAELPLNANATAWLATLVHSMRAEAGECTWQPVALQCGCRVVLNDAFRNEDFGSLRTKAGKNAGGAPIRLHGSHRNRIVGKLAGIAGTEARVILETSSGPWKKRPTRT